jgi:hypothetical protein
MAVDHLPGPHRFLTYEAFGLVSAAEGFVFLAGLVSALYATHLLKKGGMPLVQKKMHQRSRLIYLFHVSLVLSLVLFGFIVRRATSHTFGHDAIADPVQYSSYWNAAFKPFWSQPIWASVMALLLIYQPPLLDILPLYCIFQFLAPYLMEIIHRGHMRTLLVVSFIFWLTAQIQASQEMIHWLIPLNWDYTYWVFDPFAWQFLYVVGFVCGTLREDKVFFFSHYIPWLVYLSAAVVSTGLYIRYQIDTPPDLYNPLMHRSWLAPFRLVNALALFYLIGLVLNRWGELFNHSWLAWLGRYSLIVFTYHLVFIYIGDFWFQRLLLLPYGWLAIVGIGVVLVASMYLFVRLFESWQRRYKEAAEVESRGGEKSESAD